MKSELPVIDEAEVAVVGAGPAGTATAIALARLGREVILIDQSRFPRDKPCGDGLLSSAVEHLEHLGLDELVADGHPIEGTLVTRAAGRPLLTRYAESPGGRPLPRCVRRLRMDEALFKAALASGARFVLGRVQETVERDGRVVATRIRRADGERAQVRARHFIAADGATSRMRRTVGVGPAAFGARAYAVRQYFRTERALEPLFDIRMPLRFAGRFLPGYGWVFPVAEKIANIGVGFYRDPGVDRSVSTSLRAALGAFVDELRLASPAKFGDMEALSGADGAPVAVGFQAAATHRGNVVFVGDAARMTDPMIGEGIAAALRSGTEAATEVDRALRRMPRSDFGRRIFGMFPRLGQDAGLVMRTSERLLASAGPGPNEGDGSAGGHVFMDGVVRLVMRGSDDEPTMGATPVLRLVAQRRDTASTELLALDRYALDTLRTEFPFALELLHRELRADAGPTCAATLLLTTAAYGGAPGERSQDAALAVELVELAAHFLGQVNDASVEPGSSLSNGLATFVADHALSHSLRAIAALGTKETIGLARVTRTVYEGAMLEVGDAWDVDRPADRYFAAVGDRAGSLHAYAAGLGARLAGADGVAADLARFGHNLGIALQISNDVVELVAGDYATARAPGEALRHGSFSLPAICALEDDPELRRLLGPAEIEDSLEEVVRRIRESHAIERCAADCERFASAARAALAKADLEDPEGLDELARLAVDRCRAHLQPATCSRWI